MQYMLLIYDDENVYKTLSESEHAKIMAEFGAFTQDTVKSGHFRAGGRLASVSTATTVSEKDGKRLTTDGPFAETKEQLGGYYLMECRDLDEALQLAGRIPSVRVGGKIEVRPIMPNPRERQ